MSDNQRTISITSCARCGQDHKGVPIKQFEHPIEDTDGSLWTHWCMCPVNDEPVLVKMLPKPETE